MIYSIIKKIIKGRHSVLMDVKCCLHYYPLLLKTIFIFSALIESRLFILKFYLLQSRTSYNVKNFSESTSRMSETD